MTDPLDALRTGRDIAEPVNPDPRFAAALRERLRRALLTDTGGTMTTTENETTQDLRWGPSLTPYLIVADGRGALDWYVRVFDAKRRGEPYVMEDGSIGHAELAIGDAVLMLAEGTGDTPVAPPGEQLPSHSLHLQVSDVDATVRRAEAAGATIQRRPDDQGYGRVAALLDPYGHRWVLNQPPVHARMRHDGDVGYLTMVTPDAAMAREFYGAVLGWHFVPGRDENHWHIPGMQPMTGLSGDPDALPGARPFFRVSNMDTALAAVRAAGGQAGPAQRQDYGLLAECVDNQGVPFALMQLN
ncbi:VOC family protein [Labedaea rhizosphaerae]|uniref:Putative glyoxalase superfamily protein PhnB n=1 Tax=Labedaea rhizosphaerae TaxID=598644 RepID=A0A4R6RXA5_LABRH|nr:VOC family protein [Labedaea rhizosphaerae]TDP91147.1 putative glyoxalase superfamily protein PhnB [Labedaea rhizosphaerae]